MAKARLRFNIITCSIETHSVFLLIFAAMRFFTLLLSIYLLVLSCVPCEDSEECNVKGVYTISQAANHDQHNHDTENCSPFCTCSCCPASAFYQPLPYFDISKGVFQSEKYPIYSPSFCSEVSFSIWQPPKIS